MEQTNDVKKKLNRLKPAITRLPEGLFACLNRDL